MYIINISVKDGISKERHDELFSEHSSWFKRFFDEKKFLMLGPYTDTNKPSGVIFAVTNSREELDEILKQDSYYPDLATYEIREFSPKMISDDFVKSAVK
ncbi:YciI family protein [Campylobacter gastrosuis]|uniref:YCII-related domain-containing protein n=1 Tax=Campylobacter gastrosuis TaxID=2974576 RepID=A0ABT7HRQ8_9BACT|nr:hypothetical protein [Campylobacter gastrosuis]MDL0089417.1 hypothetical protein [Campylobacter gastrosuis]